MALGSLKNTAGPAVQPYPRIALRRRMIWSVAVVAAMGVSLLLVVKFIGAPAVVFGDSMLPTLHPWDVCWMQRVRPFAPARGDVIMFRTADDPPLRFIKRVIALPGERIEIQNGIVFILVAGGNECSAR